MADRFGSRARVTVLGVDVDDGLLASWCEWLAPARQPFFGEAPEQAHDRASVPAGAITPELRDTYRLWRLPERDRRAATWLDEEEFMALAPRRRAALVRAQATIGRGAVPVVRRWLDVFDGALLRAQADGHRFVWWPSLVGDSRQQVLRRVIDAEEPASRHREVDARTWERCARVVPAAEALAGTFAPGSGANCFGTVMAAAGDPGAANTWMEQQPFVDWLRDTCRPGGDDQAAGTVLVWFTASWLPVHAAITIGDGWALEKASQCWWSPRTVLAVRDLIRVNRVAGQRLRRYRINGG